MESSTVQNLQNGSNAEDASAAELSGSAETQDPGPADYEPQDGDVVDCADPEFIQTVFQLTAYEQTSTLGQHYLTIKDNKIHINGNKEDSYTKLRIHTTAASDPSGGMLVVIEGIQADKDEQKSLISINRQSNKLELVHKKGRIARLKEVPKEVLFVTKYRGELLSFQAYGEDTDYRIRFNDKGLPDTPTGCERGSFFHIV